MRNWVQYSTMISPVPVPDRSRRPLDHYCCYWYLVPVPVLVITDGFLFCCSNLNAPSNNNKTIKKGTGNNSNTSCNKKKTIERGSSTSANIILLWWEKSFECCFTNNLHLRVNVLKAFVSLLHSYIHLTNLLFF